MANLLAIDTSTAWCSVALSLGGQLPTLKHEAVSAGASQLLLPWVQSLLSDSKVNIKDLNAIAVDIGPGAFTGVRLGIAAVQGLAISHDIPVIPVSSLDALAAQLIDADAFKLAAPHRFMIAIDARMEEVYWAQYEAQETKLPKRIGNIHLTKPEDLNFDGVQFLAGNAIHEYKHRMPKFAGEMDPEITISALGILKCAQQSFQAGERLDVRDLEPLYVRDKVAFTTAEREAGKQ